MNQWKPLRDSLNATDPLFDRHALYRRVDEAIERMDREEWARTLGEIKGLPEVTR